MDLINDYTIALSLLATGIALVALWLGWHDNRMRIRRLEELEDSKWNVEVEKHTGEVSTRMETLEQQPRIPRWMRRGGEDD